MEMDILRELLESVRRGDVAVDEALIKLRDLPYEDIGFAKLDHHRALRNGWPEVIFCPGKAPDHLMSIAQKLIQRNRKALATRADSKTAELLLAHFPGAIYHELARIVVLPGIAPSSESSMVRSEGTVLVVSAGTADVPVAEEAYVTASELGSKVERLYDVGVAGLHRLLDKREMLFSANVLIVVAGMEGALASVVGGLVSRPVIAVPTSVGYGASFGGLAALLAMLNSCAAGVSVMNIDNGFGAGYFAHMINQQSEIPVESENKLG
jgi:NCAIR mutase (PurE)-related protein